MIYLVTGQQNMFEDMGTDVSFTTAEELIEYFKDHDEIDFDTETMGFDPYTCAVLSAQFGDAKHQYVVDTTTIPLETFRSLFEDPNICWNMQNAKFDLKFLYHAGIIPVKIFDTYLAERVLTTGNKRARKGLDYLVYKYCKQTMDKTVRGRIHREGLSKRVILYAAKDVAYLSEIKRKQMVYLEEQDLMKAMDLDNMYVKVLAYTEYSGFKLDAEKWKEKMKKDNERLSVSKTQLDDWVISKQIAKYIDDQLDLFSSETKCKINWSSSKQVVVLFKELGIDTQVKDKKTGKIKDSVDAKVITPQKNKSDIVPIYLEYKAAEKVVTTYGKTWLRSINPISGRIHTNYTQIMDTGRLSCGGKNFATKEEYHNFQNIPTGVERDCFVPEKGYSFIVSDYSGQEQVVLANQSLDPNLLQFYDQGLGDMHSFNASKIYPELSELPLSDIKKDHSPKRQMAKSAGFAINYGGNGSTIANNLSIPIEQGEAVYDAYLAAFPGLTGYWDKNKSQALRDGYVLFNHVTKRKSYVDFYEEYLDLEKKVREYGFWEKYRREKAKESETFLMVLRPLVRNYFKYKGTIERKALNYPVQGTSADITKLAGVYLFHHLQENGLLFKVLLPNVIHDEIMVEAPDAICEKLAEETRKCMEKAGARFYNRVPLKADPHVGQTWEH